MERYEDTNIGMFLSEKERHDCINDVKQVYPGGSRWLRSLINMPDKQLLAFRNSLMRQGKLNKARRQVHINALMREFLANTFVERKHPNKHTAIHFGKETRRDTLQTGFVIMDKYNRVVEINLLGDINHRYLGFYLKR